MRWTWEEWPNTRRRDDVVDVNAEWLPIGVDNDDDDDARNNNIKKERPSRLVIVGVE